MDNVQVHIWQLQEKTDSINKDTDIIMVHDKYALKKASVKKLFEYLNQDYKIESTIAFFDNKMKEFDDKYNVLYTSLELSLNEYDKLIDELQSKFEINRDKIRVLETTMNKMYSDIVINSKSLNIVDKELSILTDTLNNFSSIINDLEKSSGTVYESLDENFKQVFNALDEYGKIEDNTNSIKSQIETIKENITSYNQNKSNELISKINAEYDKILAILDYYHHIHEESQ